MSEEYGSTEPGFQQTEVYTQIYGYKFIGVLL